MLTSTHKTVERKLVSDADECAEPDCTHDFTVGIQVIFKKHKTYFTLFTLTNIEDEKVYCPYHSESEEHTKEALVEQEKQRNKKQYEKIANSEILPRFRLRYDKRKAKAELIGPADRRSKAVWRKVTKDGAVEKAVDAIKSISTDDPILFLNEPNEEVQIFGPDDREVVDTYTPESAKPMDKFREEYSNVNYKERDYYMIRTNDATNRSNIRSVADEVIEMSEYRKLTDETPYQINYCPACSSRTPTIRGVHRVIIDEKEQLIPHHVYNGCSKCMGRINRDLIDEEKFDFR